MSTILKALRRLEEDRSGTTDRPLREEVTSGGHGDAEPRGRGALLLVGLVAAVLGVGAGVFAYRSATQETPDLAAGAPGVAASKPAPAPLRVRERAPEPAFAAAPVDDAMEPAAEAFAQDDVERELPDVALTSPVERLERPPPEPRIGDEPPEPAPRVEVAGRIDDPAQMPGRHKRREAMPVLTARAPEPAPVPQPAEPAASPQPSPTVARTAPPAEDPWDVAAAEAPTRVSVPEPARPQPRVARPEPTPEPTAAPAPERAVVAEPRRDETPEPNRSVQPAPTPGPAPVASTPAPTPAKARPSVEVAVQRTSWHPSAERRTAIVAVGSEPPRELREGDSVGSLEVSRIEPSAVVFVSDGVELRRRVGESR